MAETLIYLDHAATTPVRPDVVEAMLPFLRDYYGNPSSLHRAGTRVRRAISTAREQVAHLIGAQPTEILFTSGGTESDNLAIAGIANQTNGTIAVAATEHHAVLHSAERWSKRGNPALLAVDATGRLEWDALSDALQSGVALVSVMHGNNETGILQPIESIGSQCRERGVPYHVDAVQSAGHIPIDVAILPLDLLSLSGHKLGGPKGVGALYVRHGVQLSPLVVGGGQEAGLRAGTENIASIIGFGFACERSKTERTSERERLTALRDRFERGIEEYISGCAINSGGAERLPHISNISFSGVDGEGILYGLDAEGICVSTGSACTAGTASPSHVLRAMGQSADRARSAVRFSFGPANTEADVDRVLNVLPRVINELRA